MRDVAEEDLVGVGQRSRVRSASTNVPRVSRAMSFSVMVGTDSEQVTDRYIPSASVEPAPARVGEVAREIGECAVTGRVGGTVGEQPVQRDLRAAGEV